FASFFPAVGKGATFMMVASNVAISLLFFLHGARLYTDAIVSGVKDVRLHALILACTPAVSRPGPWPARPVSRAADAVAGAGRA
ncbi:bile acid:sodium symporter, partial [Paenibacillus polymyxa]|nr:bile acid:sodium symporter [Paenibacillus polymyxa]